MNIAVLGLGLLGVEIALRLQHCGHNVIGWNRSTARADAARARGLTVAARVADAIAAADFTLLLLSDARAIDATLFESPHAPSLSGCTLVQMGTIAPNESRTLAERVAAHQGRYLEAPVLGSLPEARAGTLLIMAGGTPELYARCLPLFDDLSRDPRHIGAVGQGAALKLAMNQLIVGLTATFALSLGLVRRQGLEVETFMALLRASALYAATFDKKLDKYLAHDYSAANFPLKHLHKDVDLFRRVAEANGLDTSLLDAVAARCRDAEHQGYAEADYAALYEALVPR